MQVSFVVTSCRRLKIQKYNNKNLVDKNRKHKLHPHLLSTTHHPYRSKTTPREYQECQSVPRPRTLCGPTSGTHRHVANRDMFGAIFAQSTTLRLKDLYRASRQAHDDALRTPRSMGADALPPSRTSVGPAQMTGGCPHLWRTSSRGCTARRHAPALPPSRTSVAPAQTTGVGGGWPYIADQ